MESILLSIHPSDPLWIAIAFICGFAVKLIGLPPLVGFLFAGFALNALGAEGGQFLNATADLGITLLLFTIGLKLRLSSLAKPEVWGVATVHMLAITLLIAAIVMAFSSYDFSLFAGVDIYTALLIGFALSFSSTVFAIKILDQLGATMSRHGNISIGLLVVQDVAAVIFLAASTGKIPSLWAIGLLLLIPLRHVLQRIMAMSGHGELLILFGIVVALGGADIFEMVGMKGDVGALVLGMLLAPHAKASELSKALLSFKELFLVGFFLSVGMTAMPTMETLLVALVFIAVLPFKTALYFVLFNLFKLRASTSWRTSLNLANYSEFGLIVGTLASSVGWLPVEWLAVFAIVMSLSFMVSAPLTGFRDGFYTRHRNWFKKFERQQRISGEEDLELEHVEAVIFGMGRVGSAVYHALEKDFSENIIGVEIDSERAQRHIDERRHVIHGDATNPDFWSRTPTLVTGLKWVLLTMSSHNANVAAAKRLLEMGYNGKIAATSQFDDEAAELQALGVDYTFNIYAEAGIGFADQIRRQFDECFNS